MFICPNFSPWNYFLLPSKYLYERYLCLKCFSNFLHSIFLLLRPFTFLRCSHQMVALPFKLEMEILAFSLLVYSWIQKYFLMPISQASTSCHVLLSPSKAGGFTLLNSPCGWSLWEIILPDLIAKYLEPYDKWFDPLNLLLEVSNEYVIFVLLCECEPLIGVRDLPREWLISPFFPSLPLF